MDTSVQEAPDWDQDALSAGHHHLPESLAHHYKRSSTLLSVYLLSGMFMNGSREQTPFC